MTLSSRVPELGALELLLAVARHGSLGRAAAELGISQPAASARIQGVERQLGVPLLERSPRGSRPTPAGQLVIGWARQVVEAAEALDAGISALREDRDARLRVVASLTVAEYLMPGWLLALAAARPQTVVTLRTANSAAVAERLLAGEADLGFVEGPRTPAGLTGTVVATDRLVVVVSPATPGPGAAPRSPAPSWPPPHWCCASRAPAPARCWTGRWPGAGRGRARCSNWTPARR